MAVQGSVVSDVACWARSLSLDLQVRVNFRDPATQSCIQLLCRRAAEERDNAATKTPASPSATEQHDCSDYREKGAKV